MKKLLLLTLLLPLATVAFAQYDQNETAVRLMDEIVPIVITGIIFTAITMIVFLITFFRYRIKREHYRMLSNCVASGQPVPEVLVDRSASAKRPMSPVIILLIVAFVVSIVLVIISSIGVAVDSDDWFVVLLGFLITAVASMVTLIYQNNRAKKSQPNPENQENQNQ